jgi:hypothetical protein
MNDLYSFRVLLADILHLPALECFSLLLSSVKRILFYSRLFMLSFILITLKCFPMPPLSIWSYRIWKFWILEMYFKINLHSYHSFIKLPQSNYIAMQGPDVMPFPYRYKHLSKFCITALTCFSFLMLSRPDGSHLFIDYLRLFSFPHCFDSMYHHYRSRHFLIIPPYYTLYCWASAHFALPTYWGWYNVSHLLLIYISLSLNISVKAIVYRVATAPLSSAT